MTQFTGLWCLPHEYSAPSPPPLCTAEKQIDLTYFLPIIWVWTPAMNVLFLILRRRQQKFQKGSLGADWLIATGAYPGFCSMKRLELFLLLRVQRWYTITRPLSNLIIYFIACSRRIQYGMWDSWVAESVLSVSMQLSICLYKTWLVAIDLPGP